VTWASRYVRGALSRAFVLGVLGPMTNGSFAVGATLAIAHLPTVYDVRHTWVSAVASARNNPDGYAYLGTVFLAVPLMLVPLPGYLAGCFRTHVWLTRAGALLLAIGIAGLFLLGVETTVFPNPGRTRRAHHVFTVISFLGLTPGFFTFSALAARRAWTLGTSLVPAGLACAVLVVPDIGAGLAELTYFLGKQGWISRPASRHELAFYRAFVFWEWAAVIGLFVGGWLTAWAASRDQRGPGARPPG
jgi:hypothetical protein